jgi:hypothetical protein
MITGPVTSSSSSLKRAAAAGRLQTVRVHGRLRLTRQEWLDAYLATLDTRRGPPRGQPRTKKEQP